MATVRDSVEGSRGCGYRKGGGIYLIAGGIPRPCGKLPIPLTTCPTCSGGIKPARGWTWVDSGILLANVLCEMKGDYCSMCPLNRPLGRAGLLWIGEKFYPTPESWMAESQKLGVSRRIAQVPKELEIGKTWVLVAHRKVIPDFCPDCKGTGADVDGNCEECEGEGKVKNPAIFHAFQPTALEYVVKGGETEDELNKLEKRGFVLVNVIPDKKEAAGLFEEGDEENP